jgi:predicted ATPase
MTGEVSSITVKGFKSLKNVEKFPLRPINILIGANGSGKSNFIGIFALLHALREGRLREYTEKRGGADRILHFGSKVTDEIDIEVEFKDQTNAYHVTLAPTEDDAFYTHGEWCWYWGKGYPNPYYERLKGVKGEAGISRNLAQRKGQGARPDACDYVQARLDRWRIYHFHDTSASSPMKKTVDVDDNRFFRSDGSNLAAFLLEIRTHHQESYERLCDVIRQVAPFFKDFRLEPLLREESKIRLEWSHTSTDRYFDASSLSDGTLRFICLSTLFLQPAALRPSLILLDEPELGLHPYAITMLAAMIKAASVETQVLVSTQSSLLLDHFEPEDVIVAERRDDSTTLSRLDPDDLTEWLEDYSLGELWEKNQIGGRPGSAQIAGSC